ncbi:MAG: hypothetical protein FWH43_04130 [Endomicrobia bacterium]|nr:hypothetical protein [Endomicrobiia bacterium]
MEQFKISRTLITLALSVILITAVILFFKRTIEYRTIQFDDIIFADALYPQYAQAGIVKKIFASSVYIGVTSAYYRPVLPLSFCMDSLISKGKPDYRVNHTTNIILHIICVLLLFYFCKTYCFPLLISFFLSAIFALNIFSLHTVAWISGRNDSLLFIFVFLSFIFFIKANEDKNNKILFYIWHIIFFCIALLTKESAFMIPILCLSYGLFLKKYKKSIPVYCVWVICMITVLFIRSKYVNNNTLFEHIFNLSDLKNNIYMVCDYLTNAFLLSKDIIYPQFSLLVFIKGTAIAAMLVIFGSLSDNKRNALFFLSFFIIFLSPNFLIDRILFQGNRMYLPFAFLLIAVFYMIAPLFKKYKAAACCITFVFIICSALNANNRVNIFYDQDTFFSDTDDMVKLKSNLLWEFKLLTYLNFIDHSKIPLETLEKRNIADKNIIQILISVNLQLENYQKALEYALKYESFLEKDKDYYDLLIFCYVKLGEYEKADQIKALSDK